MNVGGIKKSQQGPSTFKGKDSDDPSRHKEQIRSVGEIFSSK